MEVSVKLVVSLATGLVLVGSLAACGSTQTDTDKIAALGDKAVSAMHEGNVSKIAGLMDPSCSGSFLGSAAMAKAFGIDLGDFMKSAASDLNGQVKKENIVIQGDTAYVKTDLTSPLAVKVNGHWFMDCSDTSDSTSS